MSTLIHFAFSVVFTAMVLAALPFVRYKNFLSCLKVSLLVGVFAIPVRFLSVVATFISGFFLLWIPILGPLAMGISFFLIQLFFSAIALYIADQMVEDLEIKTFSETFTTATIISIASAAASMFL